MNISAILKRLLKKQITTLASISGKVFILNREELDENSDKLYMLDKYKSDYGEVLSLKRTIFSGNFGNNNIYEEIKMYQSLIMNLINEEEKEVSFEKIYKSDGTKELEYKCKTRRLEAYIQSLLIMWEDIQIKITALYELRKERVFLSPYKKQALNEEINNLSNLYIVIQSLIGGLSAEIKGYITKYEIISTEESTSEENMNKLLKEKRIELENMINLVEPNILKSLSNIEDDKLAVCLMETELEKYLYTYKEELSLEIRKSLNMGWNRRESQDILLKRIKDLELKCKVLNEYSNFKITKEDIFKLYEKKFIILSMNIYDQQDGDMVKDATYTEIECYEEIIFKEIDKIQRGIKISLAKFSNQTEVIELITKVLKDGKDEYSWWDILTNQKLLAFLLAFNLPYNGLDEYFKKITVEKSENDNIVDFHEDIFEWESIVPLETLINLIIWNEADTNVNPLVELYKKSKEYTNKEYFSLPEGLKKISIHDNLKSNDKSIIYKLKAMMPDKIVKTPSTLKSMEGNLFNPISWKLEYLSFHYIAGIELNEGLESISNGALSRSKLDYLCLPLTLSTIKSNVFNNLDVNTIYINCNKDEIPKIIFNHNFIRDLFTDISCIFQQYGKLGLYEIKPIFKKLILKREGKEDIIITNDDLTIEIELSDTYYHIIKNGFGCLDTHALVEIEKKLKDVIKKYNEDNRLTLKKDF